ncbi:response regulator, partial [bacterium]|nr:response regulator [bacterium]
MSVSTILVVEDEASQRNALCAFLKKRGYQFIEAGDKAAAVRAFESKTIDLVLSDMRLPDGS